MQITSVNSARVTALLILALEFSSLPAIGASPTPMPPAIVKQVDHVLLASSEANALFALLAETFQLPVVWPMSNYGNFGSGGVALGNVNLEVIRTTASRAGDHGSRFIGLALEPERLPTSLAELDARHITHGSPAPFRAKFATLWTTVALPEVSSDALEIFLCAYAHDETARRQQFREQLRGREGGPLSVHSMREIVCGARNVAEAETHWRKLLHPVTPSTDGAWQLGTGPAIRFVAADADQLQEVIVNVTSLEQARRFLARSALLGSDRITSLTIASPRFPGFHLTLVELPGAAR